MYEYDEHTVAAYHTCSICVQPPPRARAPRPMDKENHAQDKAFVPMPPLPFLLNPLHRLPCTVRPSRPILHLLLLPPHTMHILTVAPALYIFTHCGHTTSPSPPASATSPSRPAAKAAALLPHRHPFRTLLIYSLCTHCALAAQTRERSRERRLARLHLAAGDDAAGEEPRRRRCGERAVVDLGRESRGGSRGGLMALKAGAAGREAGGLAANGRGGR